MKNRELILLSRQKHLNIDFLTSKPIGKILIDLIKLNRCTITDTQIYFMVIVICVMTLVINLLNVELLNLKEMKITILITFSLVDIEVPILHIEISSSLL